MGKPIIDYLTGKGVFLVHCSAITNSNQLRCGIIFIEKGVEKIVQVIDPSTGDRYDVLIPQQSYSPLFDENLNYAHKYLKPDIQDTPIS